MTNRAWTMLIIVLAIIIAVLVWLLVTLPAPANTPIATSTAATTTPSGATTGANATSTEPLHSQITVTYPKSGASVQPKFTVIGKVPGNWSFEAQFPVQVRDSNNTKIGQTSAHLEGDWMTTGLVDFTAEVVVSGYHGPATLVLLRDNPSGMPENDDSLEVPIVIQ